MSLNGKSRRWLQLPIDPLFRLLVINGLAGLGIAALVLGGIFLTNIGNLTVLVQNADDPVIPVLMLAFGLVITLGSVVMGSAIMLLGESGRSGGTPGRRQPGRLERKMQPIQVKVPANRRSRFFG